MPLNTLRLNHAPSSHPNDRIVFIKPLPRAPSDKAAYDAADTFLRAIAAQCLPIMKGHHLAVTTLAEHEPNREFIGRNFNNGEIIELVLRTHSGGWVSFQMVQMVMMHELAHNVHMNHSKAFWQTRNLFSEEMRKLWAKCYTGEGFWGGGKVLGDLSSVMGNNIVPSEELRDIEVCGGTFRSRRRKRKATATPDLTWKEKRDRRIEKKFGKSGERLGEDEDQRIKLEIARKGPIGGKPRVAGSKRGRELRAAAALARFGPNKRAADADQSAEAEEQTLTDGSDEEFEEVDEHTGEDAVDSNGHRMLDKDGKGLVRVCGEEDGPRDEVQLKKEMDELEGLDKGFTLFRQHHNKANALEEEGDDDDDDDDTASPPAVAPPNARISSTAATSAQDTSTPHPPPPLSARTAQPTKHASPSVQSNLANQPVPTPTTTSTPSTTITCPICSMDNAHLSPTCIACAHVLDKKKIPNHWVCESEACRQDTTAGSSDNTRTEYVNSGDCGRCGVCGASKPAS